MGEGQQTNSSSVYHYGGGTEKPKKITVDWGNMVFEFVLWLCAAGFLWLMAYHGFIKMDTADTLTTAIIGTVMRAMGSYVGKEG